MLDGFSRFSSSIINLFGSTNDVASKSTLHEPVSSGVKLRPAMALKVDVPDEDSAPRLPDGSILMDIEEECTSPRRTDRAGATESSLSLYGKPVTPERAAELCPPGDGGLIWHAQLLPSADSNAYGANPDGTIKPRRGQLPVLGSDFFSSLVQTADGRWIFSGVLNGWPGLTVLELRSLTFVSESNIYKVVRHWTADAPGAAPPSMPDGEGSVRATLRAPPWSASGCARWPRSSDTLGHPIPNALLAYCTHAEVAGSGSRSAATRQRAAALRGGSSLNVRGRPSSHTATRCWLQLGGVTT